MDEPNVVWRPRLWVRVTACALPLLCASTLLYPGTHPTWAHGIPAEELPWLGVMIVVTAATAIAALVSTHRDLAIIGRFTCACGDLENVALGYVGDITPIEMWFQVNRYAGPDLDSEEA